jgi:hypothetical protein
MFGSSGGYGPSMDGPGLLRDLQLGRLVVDTIHGLPGFQ